MQIFSPKKEHLFIYYGKDRRPFQRVDQTLQCIGAYVALDQVITNKDDNETLFASARLIYKKDLSQHMGIWGLSKYACMPSSTSVLRPHLHKIERQPYLENIQAKIQLTTLTKFTSINTVLPISRNYTGHLLA